VIRLLIADDQELLRAGFRVVLDAEPDLEVVGEAENGEQAIELSRRLRPDVVLMDVRMPVLDGISATRRIRADAAADGGPRVLVLTTFDLDEHVYDALRAGAGGFLLKDVKAAQLADAVRVVAAGDALIAPSITKRLVAEFAARPGRLQRPQALEELTARELEVLRLIARGLSNGEIAASLVVSEATVKTHVTRILGKLGLRDRVQAVVLAYESGLVTPGSD
jgi:DNA-binding NarL/FixJ family response regulator